MERLSVALTREQKGAKRRFCESVLNALFGAISYRLLSTMRSRWLAKMTISWASVASFMETVR